MPPMSAPAPKVNPPAARSAVRPLKAPATIPPIAPDVPRRSDRPRESPPPAAREWHRSRVPERPCSAISLSVVSRTRSSSRLASRVHGACGVCVHRLPPGERADPSLNAASQSAALRRLPVRGGGGELNRKRLHRFSKTARLRVRHAARSRPHAACFFAATASQTAASSLSSCTQHRAKASSAIGPLVSMMDGAVPAPCELRQRLPLRSRAERRSDSGAAGSASRSRREFPARLRRNAPMPDLRPR